MGAPRKASSGATHTPELAGNGPAPFAFGEAPESADFTVATEEPKKTGLETHTGTDPHGRAIGPAEDHTKAKRDIDGLTAVEAAEKAAEEDEEQL
ncbi:hypothetical protein [Nocardioides marmoraquaticus]